LINMTGGEVEDFRDLIFMTVAAHPKMISEKPELVREVIAVFAEAQQILLDPARGPHIMGKEFATMTPEANKRAYEVVTPIWSPDGGMTADGAKKVMAFLQPQGSTPINLEKTFSNGFLPTQK